MNTGGFLLLPSEREKCNTSCLLSTPRASPTSTVNKKRATHSSKKKQEKVKKNSDWTRNYV